MIKIRLSDALLRDAGGFGSRHYSDSEWWMAYEWFCRALLDFRKASPRPRLEGLECLNATSAINCYDFWPFSSDNEPRHRLAYLVAAKHGGGADFLHYLGIHNWADLEKTIEIRGRKPKLFPMVNWFRHIDRRLIGDLCGTPIIGAKLNYSPNSCWPKAKLVLEFALKYIDHSKYGHWGARIAYGISEKDESRWYLWLYQEKGESLDSFAVRIQSWLDEQVVPQ